MKSRVYLYLPLCIVGFALLLVLPSPAAADQRVDSAVESGAVLPAQATCDPCLAAAKRCSAKCAGLGKSEAIACLGRCDNATATCSCDDVVTLRSEDLVSFEWPSSSTKAAACHSTTPCGTAYPSCASWSSYSDCGDPICGVANHCGEDCPSCEFGPCPCFGPATRQFRERFRVCFNSAEQSCTEWQRTNILLGCGC